MAETLPAVQETGVQPLDREDPLEEGVATASTILAWRIPMDRGARWATVHGLQSWTRLSDEHTCIYQNTEALKQHRLETLFLSSPVLLITERKAIPREGFEGEFLPSPVSVEFSWELPPGADGEGDT